MSYTNGRVDVRKGTFEGALSCGGMAQKRGGDISTCLVTVINMCFNICEYDFELLTLDALSKWLAFCEVSRIHTLKHKPFKTLDGVR